MGVRALIAFVLYFAVLVRGQFTAAGSALLNRELGLADIPACGVSRAIEDRETVANSREDPLHAIHSTRYWLLPGRPQLCMQQ